MDLVEIDPVDRFIDSLEGELLLRKRELTNVWFYSAQEDNTLKKESLLRNNVLIIYAHWEGFIKSSSIKYLKYICKREIPCQLLTINFKALHIKKISKGTTDKPEWERFLEIADQNFNDVFMVKAEFVIDTESNLKSEVLNKIIKTLNVSEFRLADNILKLLDNGLLSDRNAIAHGEMKKVPLIHVQSYHELILELLESYKDKLIDMVISEFYLAPPMEEVIVSEIITP
jgi:succinate dehydrogenase flavin-adding protein (antitoxin of CptAB toxin-antitoxin module)